MSQEGEDEYGGRDWISGVSGDIWLSPGERRVAVLREQFSDSEVVLADFHTFATREGADAFIEEAGSPPEVRWTVWEN